MPVPATQERGRKESRSADRASRKASKGSKGRSSSRGSSSSRSRGSSRSRSPGKRSAAKKEKKKKKKKKKGKKGLESDKPIEEWSRELLLDKLGLFGEMKIDRMSGSGSLTVKNQRIMGENFLIFKECLSRFNEINHVTVQKCFCTDDMFAEMVELMTSLRHLKSLIVPFNGLTSESVNLICRKFGNVRRVLETLDMRENQVDDEDGHRMYRAFGHSITTLNGVPIKETKADVNKTVINLSNSKLKLPDVAVLVDLIKECSHVQTIDISRNYIDCEGAKLIASVIPLCKGLGSIDISSNPLTNQDKDHSGVIAISKEVIKSGHVFHINIKNCGADPQLVEKTERSASVNTAVFNTRRVENTYFTDYVRKKLEPMIQAPPVNHWLDYDPDFILDPDFVRRQKCNEMLVDTPPNQIKLHRKVNGPHGFGMKF